MDSIDIIKKNPLLHCARGPNRCEKCKEAEKKGNKFCLIRAYLKPGNIARPMTYILVDAQNIFCEYDVLKVFSDIEEAKEYSKTYTIDIME